MSSRPEPVVPTPSKLMRRPISSCTSASPAFTTSTGSSVGLHVDLLHHRAGRIDDHEVGRDRTDVDAHVGVDLAPVLGPLVGPRHVAQQHHALHRERLGDREVGRRCAPGVERGGGEVAGRIGIRLEKRGADRAHREVVLRYEQAAVLEAEGLAQRLDCALVGGDAADEGDGRLDGLALRDGASEVADDGVAQASQDLRRLVSLLLRVDHVRLGEHAAAAGDAGRLAGSQHDVADVLDVVEQTAGLLVHERPRAGCAIAVGLVVGDARASVAAPRLETDELGRLPTHLEHGLRGPG